MTCRSLKVIIVAPLVALCSGSCKSVDKNSSEVANSNIPTLANVEAALTKILAPHLLKTPGYPNFKEKADNKMADYEVDMYACGHLQNSNQPACLRYSTSRGNAFLILGLQIFSPLTTQSIPTKLGDMSPLASIGCADYVSWVPPDQSGYASVFVNNNNVLEATLVCSQNPSEKNPYPSFKITRDQINPNQPSQNAVVSMTSKGKTTTMVLTEKPFEYKPFE